MRDKNNPNSKKADGQTQAIAPLIELRIPPSVLSILFTVFAGYLFVECWKYFPLFPYIFDVILEAWNRDAANLIPSFPGFFIVWGWNIVSIVLVTVFEIVSWQTGRKAFSWGTGRKPRGLIGALFSLAIGNGILGTGSLGLGLTGLISRLVFVVLLFVPFSFFIGNIVRLRKSGLVAGNPILAFKTAHFSLLDWALAGFCAFITLYNILPALQPEWFYDSLVYHLALPARWLTEHRICHLPDTFIATYPFLQEMQYLIFLSIGIDTPTRLLHWINGIECMAGVYLIARSLLGRTGALLAAAIFASLPPLRFLQYSSMVELGLSRYSVLAMFAFMSSNGMLKDGKADIFPRRAWLILCAWCLGLGHATKYLGIFISLIIFIQIVIDWTKAKTGLKRLLADMTLVTAWASVWTIPWLFKNWLFAGNPVFPMLGWLFPSSLWDANINRRWMEDNTRYGTGHGSVLNWLKMPVLASAGTADFGTFSLNPFFLLFLPLLVFIRGIPASIRFMAGSAAIYFILWAVSSQQTRFFIPIAPMASVATAFVITRAGEGRNLLKGLLWAATFWVFLSSLIGEAQNRLTTKSLIPYSMGRISKSSFLIQGVQYYRSIENANLLIPRDSRVIFLGGDESYYLEKRLICSSIYDRSAIGEMAKIASSPSNMRRLFKNKRITHLVYHEPRAMEYIRYGVFDWGEKAQNIFISFLSQYARLLYQGDGVYLFEFSGKPLPDAIRKMGRPLCFYKPDIISTIQDKLNQANNLIGESRFAEGLQVTQELIRIAPDFVQGYSYRGFMQERLNNQAEAMNDYKKAIRLGYPPMTAYYNLGLLYEMKKQYNQALAIYQEGIAVEDHFYPLKERCAESAFILGRNALALSLFSELAPLYPDKPAYQARIDEIKFRMGIR